MIFANIAPNRSAQPALSGRSPSPVMGLADVHPAGTVPAGSAVSIDDPGVAGPGRTR